MGIKFKVFGYRGRFNSTERLEQTIIDLGYELSDTPDCVIHFGGLFSDSEEFISKLDYKPYKIYLLLDIDKDKKDFNNFYKDTKSHLENADVICAISNVVKDQMRTYLGIDKNIEIIRFPTRPLRNWDKMLWSDRTNDFLYVGRLTGSKRIELLYDFFKIYQPDLTIASTEFPGFANYVASPSDAELEALYNNSKYTILTSSFEGLGLSVIEALNLNSIPIIMEDNKIIYELELQEFACQPTPQGIYNKSIEIQDNIDYYKAIANFWRIKFADEFKIENIARQLINLYNLNYEKPN